LLSEIDGLEATTANTLDTDAETLNVVLGEAALVAAKWSCAN